MKAKNDIIYNEDIYEINIFEVLKKIWKKRFFLIKVSLFFFIAGIIIAFSRTNIYTASCTMILQSNQKSSSSSLGGLAAIAGLNFNNFSSNDIISPTLYPKILSNPNLQREIIYSKFHFNEFKEPISFFDYYKNRNSKRSNLIYYLKKYTIGLPGIIINFFKGTDQSKQDLYTNNKDFPLLKISTQEQVVINELNNRLILSINSKEGFITLYAQMHEPLIAAELAQKGQEILQKYITKFKIEKVSSNLEFIKNNYLIAQKNFETKQYELAKYRDNNKNISTSIAKTYEEKLQSEYNLLFELYTELSKQLEQAKVSVNETTPVLTIIQPVVIPNEKSSPNRILIIISFLVIGVIIGSIIIMMEGIFTRIKLHLK